MVVGQTQCWGSRQLPQTRLPRSRPTAQFTKLYTCLTILSCFVDRTVSYEMRVHGLPNLNHPDFASSERSGTYHEDASQRSTRSDSTLSTTSAHFESMMNGMAQDIFHHPTEQNFYESSWQADFASWATNKDVQQRFFQKVQGKDDDECQIGYFPGQQYPYGETCKPAEGSKDSGRMDIFGFYALDVLGWEGLRCNAKLKGCENMPSTEYIRKFFFSDPHRARRVIYTIDSFRKIFHEYSTYNEVLEAAKIQVKGYCMDFANTFFRHDTFPEKRMCIAQIIQIVMGVIAAIVAILTLGQALYAMAPMLTAQYGGWYALTQAVGVSAEQAFLMSGQGFATIYGNSMAQALNGVGQTVLLGATSDVIISSLGIITTAGSVAASASAHHLEVKGGAASEPGNGNMMSGGAAGFIGLTAVADTIRIALGRLPAWDAAISALTDEKFREELGKLDQTTRTTAENVAKVIGKIKLPNIPDWSRIKLSSEHLAVILQRASKRTSNILSQRNHVWLVESGRRAMMKDIPAWADNGAQDVPTAEETEKIGKWMQTSLEDAILTGYGQAVGSQDLNEYIATQRRNFEDKRAATELTFRSTMSSFARSSKDNNPLPEEWGSYGHLEWVPLRELSFNPDGESPIYHQVKVKSRTFFKKYPEENSTDWSQNDRAKIVMDEDTVDDLTQENVVRLTKLFTMYPAKTPLNATDVDTVSIYGLGPRIAWRMQDEMGRAFTTKEAWSFWDKHSSEIDRRVQLLQDRKFDQSDTSIDRHVPLKFPTTALQVAAKTSFDTMSWTSLLGTVDFEGFTSSNAPNPNSPELRWRAKPSTDLQTRLGRRDAHRIMDGVAAHEIRGTLKSLEAMDLIRVENSGGMKKVKRDGGVHGRGDIFVAEVGENYFKTQFKRNACGTKYHDGNRNTYAIRCEEFLDGVVDQISDKIHRTTDFKGVTFEQSAAKIDFHKRFPTYETFMNPDVRALSKERLQEKLRENLKNSLITKAYSDQNCYMRCKPAGNGSVRGPGEKTYQYDGQSVNCKPGCYDPVSGNFDRLYGFDDGKVTQQPWNLNEERITEESWGAYARKDYTGYLPGRIDLNPYHDQIKDHTPILPVCYSTVGLGNDRKGLPCSCGDKYGNETFMVLNADYWRGQDYKDETDKFKTCLDRFKDTAKIHPGVFMINMCNAYYHLLVPVGQGTKSEKKNKGAYKENLAMCDRIRWDHIWNEDSGDRAVDRAVCKTWREYAKSKHKDGGHSDFSWANSVLRKADICGKERKKGKKGGKKNQ